MTALTPRLQTVFAKTKTVCFGRFLVDVPETATVSWGDASVELGVGVYPGGANQINEEAEEFIEGLKNTTAIYLDHIPLFLSEERVDDPSGRIITGYEGFDAVNGLQIKGYFRWGGDGIIINARPLQKYRGRAVAKIRSIAQRLRPRTEDEIPSEPGNCIEYAFVADKLTTDPEPPSEHIRIGFRLKEFPDTHLSILVGPSNPYHSESNTIEWQLARLEERQRAENPNHPMLKTKYFRRGARQIGEWLNGWEAVSRSPDMPDVFGTHDFVMDVQGVPSDVFKPYMDIKMQTGVADNLAGAVKPSLTDEEAVAVWDAITSTIRVRPTTTKASAQQTPRKPLGERLVSGRTCSQTGWWQAAEPAAAHALPRRRIEAGATMPMAVVAGKPTLWDKLKGEQPRQQVAAVWQLVAYED